MKGLILKDLYSIRFVLICSALMMLLPSTLMLILTNSDDPDVNIFASDMGFIAYGILNYVTISVFSSLALSTMSSDVACGWDKYQRTMPVSAKEIILGKQISGYIVIAILTAFSLLFNMSGLFFGVSIELLIMIPVCMGIYQTIILTPAFPLSLKINIKTANYIYLGVMMLGASLMCLVTTAAMTSAVPQVALRFTLYAGLPIASVVVGIICCKSGEKLYKRDI